MRAFLTFFNSSLIFFDALCISLPFCIMTYYDINFVITIRQHYHWGSNGNVKDLRAQLLTWNCLQPMIWSQNSAVYTSCTYFYRASAYFIIVLYVYNNLQLFWVCFGLCFGMSFFCLWSTLCPNVSNARRLRPGGLAFCALVAPWWWAHHLLSTACRRGDSWVTKVSSLFAWRIAFGATWYLGLCLNVGP